MQCFVQETKERHSSTARNHHNKPDKHRVKFLGKFHRPPLNPSKLESANYFVKQKYFHQKLPPRETKMIAPRPGRRRELSPRGDFPQEKMSQVRAVLQEAGQTLEAVLRLVVPGHQEFRRKMERNQSLGERTIAAFIFSSLALATILAL